MRLPFFRRLVKLDFGQFRDSGDISFSLPGRLRSVLPARNQPAACRRGTSRAASSKGRRLCREADSCNYPSQGKVAGKPAVAFGSAGGPSDNILGILDKAIGWFKLTKVTDSVGASGQIAPGALVACRELGRKLAEAAAKSA